MKRLGLAALLALFILSLTAVSGACQEVTVGIAEGDHFLYEYHVTVDGSLLMFDLLRDIGDPLYDFVQSWNSTDWELREVTAVSGTVTTFNVTTRFVNGTETNKMVDYNLTASDDFWAIGANMEAGEYVGTSTWTADQDYEAEVYIDETMQWTYENETRDTNTASWDELCERAMWWDKQTGVLVKEWAKFWMAHIGYPEEFVTVHAWHTLTETNRWEIPEYPTQTTLLLTLMVATATLTVYKRKSQKLLK